ncbi:MAG TPA: zinc ribbon domain-containing protein [Methanothermobacter sp.]|nr:zinc ribbon domain-containing protein [Methanothermobacter sp.]
MKCENCGAKIKKRETYCPKCGMKLFNSQYKPLKKRYLRGEYRETEEFGTSPYDLEEEGYSESTYQPNKYQNQNYNQKGEKNHQNKHNQTNPQKKYQRGYDLDEYYESAENESSIWGTIMLLLIIALLFGFVMGFVFFSTKI